MPHRESLRIGARVWKTALAVAASLAISRALGIEQPVFAGVAAIICMQPTVFGTIRSGQQRMQATLIGAIFSLAALVLLEHLPFLRPFRPLLVGLTVLAVMALTIRLKWFDSLVLAAATVVVIMVLPADQNIYLYAATRTIVTFIGIVVATAINAFFLTPQYRVPLWQRLQQLTTNTAHTYRLAVEAFCKRRLDLAEEAERELIHSEEIQQAVTVRMQWLDEEARLRRAIHWREELEVGVLRTAVSAIIETRQCMARIIRVTKDILHRQPLYVTEPSKAYEVLWDLSQLSFAIFERLETNLTKDKSEQEETFPIWTEELHKKLIHSMREAYAGPRDIFPLVEVAVIAFEIRRVTELAGKLADAFFAGKSAPKK